MSLERGVVVLLSDRVHVGSVGVLDGVPLDALLGSDSPSVVNTTDRREREDQLKLEDKIASFEILLHEADFVCKVQASSIQYIGLWVVSRGATYG